MKELAPDNLALPNQWKLIELKILNSFPMMIMVIRGLPKQATQWEEFHKYFWTVEWTQATHRYLDGNESVIIDYAFLLPQMKKLSFISFFRVLITS